MPGGSRVGVPWRVRPLRKSALPVMDREPQDRSVNVIRLERSWAGGFERRLSSLDLPQGQIIYDGAKLYLDTQFCPPPCDATSSPALQPLSSGRIDDARRD